LGSLAIISNVKGCGIFNGRGEETIEVTVRTLGGQGRTAAPAGKSKGKYEVAYFPKGGVSQAVKNLDKLVKPALIGLDADKQDLLDRKLHRIDGTKNFSKIGGNTAYAISLAAAEAAAATHQKPLYAHLLKVKKTMLPMPLGNVIGGGKHAGRGTPDIQEFLALPIRAKSFKDAYAANIKVHRRVGKLLNEKMSDFTGGKGDEGAWAPRLKNDEALEILSQAVEEISGETGVTVRPCLDVAASSFWDVKKERYRYVSEGVTRDDGEQIEFILSLIKKYKLFYVEDPLHEDDYKGFAELTRKAKGCLICGDDLFVTNKQRLNAGIKVKAANSILIKPNQVGTVTDTYETVKLAKESGLTPVVSHRSGETCDSPISHLAVAFGMPIIKTGIIGGERSAKLNELIRIEEALGYRVSTAKLGLP
jgi:enolase